jgi:protocatechuate 3,4-dioxygenase alpha subunit
VRDVLLESGRPTPPGAITIPTTVSTKKLDPGFRGWGRSCSDFTSGVWRFETIKPGPWSVAMAG